MINIPDLDSSNDQPWGPPSKPVNLKLFSDVPYAPFSKSDKLGKAADWAGDSVKDIKDQKRAQGRGFRDPFHAYGASSSSFFASESGDPSMSFSVVDSSKTGTKQGAGGRLSATLKTRSGNQQQGNSSNQQQGGRGPAGQGNQGNFGQNNRGSRGDARNDQRGPQGAHNNNNNNNWGGRRGGGGAWAQAEKVKNREPSVAVGDDWEEIQSNNLSELVKLSYQVSSGEVLARAGHVQFFDDRLKFENPEKLQLEAKLRFNVTTSEDPVIKKFISEKRAQVYSTDAILALLMSAPKTQNPWDIIIRKTADGIFLDKRDDGPLDFLSVNENVPVWGRPEAEDARKLGLEATFVNANFPNNVTTKEELTFEQPNPFAGSDVSKDNLSAKGYIYKEFNLESNPEEAPLPLIVRCEVDAAVHTASGEPGLALVKALNECGPKPLSWRQRFSNHSGAVATDEMRDNLVKIWQWAAQAMLLEARSVKLGFVSRVKITNTKEHETVGVINYTPERLANAVQFNISNAWGIVKSFVNIAQELELGNYVVMRNPNLPQIKIYRVPGSI